MRSWFSFLRGPGPARKSLRAYPPYAAPFVGDPLTFTDAQARANLAYLLAHKPSRIGILLDYLASEGVPVGALAVGSDDATALAALRQWALRAWPALATPATTRFDDWRTSRRDGPQIVHSMLMDLSILLGERMLARCPGYAWDVDLDPERRDDEEISYGRCVVMKPKGGPFPIPIVFDFEYLVAGSFFGAAKEAFPVVFELDRYYSEAVDGSHERFWLEQAARSSS
jgi:hypothetical protein